jgi:molybdenum cofactor cytidylyltransferase
MNVGVLALAAGKSRRFGSDKRLARLSDGRRCIEAFLDQLESSGLPALVCPAQEDKDLASLLETRGCPHHVCKRAAEGMGGTLAEGITRITCWDGVLVALADMPWIASDTYIAIAGRLDVDGICIPTFEGHRGHPVGFGRAFYPAIAGLSGDTGARGIVEKHPGRTTEIRLADPAILKDVDVPADISAAASSQ